jgi:hypothetical protein
MFNKNDSINFNTNTKTIKLLLNSKYHNKLFDLKDEIFPQVCNEIFEIGYNKYFCIGEEHDNHSTINDKFGMISKLVEDLTGLTNNSAKKGQIFENIIYEYIETTFRDYSFVRTRNIAHSGDCILIVPNKGNIMIELKNYSKNVDNDEIIKLLFDMKAQNIYHAIIISLKSSFVNKKRLQVEQFDGKYNILFIPNLGKDMYMIEMGVLLMEKLLDIDNDLIVTENTIQLIVEEIQECAKLISKLKTNFLKMELTVKKEFDSHYSIIREVENDIQQKINNILQVQTKTNFETKDEYLLNLFLEYRITNFKIENIIYLLLNEKPFGSIIPTLDDYIINIHNSQNKIIICKKNMKGVGKLKDYLAKIIY